MADIPPAIIDEASVLDVRCVEPGVERVRLEAMLQAYEAEFAPVTGNTPNSKGVYPLDSDLDVTDNYLLYVGGEAAGFCVKGEEQGRHDIMEFYVAPEYRGHKLGRRFAQSIFERHPGTWQVRQIEGADKAIAFWRQAIGEFTAGQYTESIEEDAYWGPVTMQVFKSPGA